MKLKRQTLNFQMKYRKINIFCKQDKKYFRRVDRRDLSVVYQLLALLSTVRIEDFYRRPNFDLLAVLAGVSTRSKNHEQQTTRSVW